MLQTKILAIYPDLADLSYELQLVDFFSRELKRLKKLSKEHYVWELCGRKGEEPPKVGAVTPLMRLVHEEFKKILTQRKLNRQTYFETAHEQEDKDIRLWLLMGKLDKLLWEVDQMS